MTIRANVKVGSRNRTVKSNFFFIYLGDAESTSVFSFLSFLLLTLQLTGWVYEPVVLNRKCVFTRTS